VVWSLDQEQFVEFKPSGAAGEAISPGIDGARRAPSILGVIGHAGGTGMVPDGSLSQFYFVRLFSEDFDRIRPSRRGSARTVW
jgi:hypothetical protein